MSGVKLIIEIDGSQAVGAVYDRGVAAGKPARAGYDPSAGPAGAVAEIVNALEADALALGLSPAELKESIYLSLAPRLLNFRVLELPFTDKAKIREVLPLELSGMLRMETDSAVLDAVLLGEGRVLALAVEKSFMRALLEGLKVAGIEPVWVGSALFAASMIKEMSTGNTVLAGPGFLVAAKDGAPLFYNPLPEKSDCSASLDYLRATGIGFDRVLVAGLDTEPVRKAVGRGVRVEPVGETGPGETNGTAQRLLFGALALQVSSNRLHENVDFRTGEFEYKRGSRRVASKLRITAALALVLVLLAGTDLYLRYARYSQSLASVNSAMLGSYRVLFPDSGGGPVADPLYLLETRLKQVEKERTLLTGISPLKVLRLFGSAASAVENGEIKITSATVTANRVVARGGAIDFEAANRFKEALSGLGIGTVTVADVKSRAGGGVGFSLTVLR